MLIRLEELGEPDRLRVDQFRELREPVSYALTMVQDRELALQEPEQRGLILLRKIGEEAAEVLRSRSTERHHQQHQANVLIERCIRSRLDLQECLGEPRRTAALQVHDNARVFESCRILDYLTLKHGGVILDQYEGLDQLVDLEGWRLIVAEASRLLRRRHGCAGAQQGGVEDRAPALTGAACFQRRLRELILRALRKWQQVHGSIGASSALPEVDGRALVVWQLLHRQLLRFLGLSEVPDHGAPAIGCRDPLTRCFSWMCQLEVSQEVLGVLLEADPTDLEASFAALDFSVLLSARFGMV